MMEITWISAISILVVTIICAILVLFWWLIKRENDDKNKKSEDKLANQNDIDQNVEKIKSDDPLETIFDIDDDQDIIDDIEAFGHRTGDFDGMSQFDVEMISLQNNENNDNKMMDTQEQNGEKDFDAQLISSYMFGGIYQTSLSSGEHVDDDTQQMIVKEREIPKIIRKEKKNHLPISPLPEPTLECTFDVNVAPNMPNIEESNSLEEENVLQKRIKLMTLLHEQYELMNKYGINSEDDDGAHALDVDMDGHEF